MADQPPRKPREGSFKVLDYESVATFFASRHRLTEAEIESFWTWIEPAHTATKFVVVGIEDALMRGGRGGGEIRGPPPEGVQEVLRGTRHQEQDFRVMV